MLFLFKVQAYQSPPKGISISVELLIWLLFHWVDQEWSQNETQKAYVPRRDELLEKRQYNKPQGNNKVIKCHQKCLTEFVPLWLGKNDHPIITMDMIMWGACPLRQTKHFINVFYFPRLYTCYTPSLPASHHITNTHSHSTFSTAY